MRGSSPPGGKSKGGESADEDNGVIVKWVRQTQETFSNIAEELYSDLKGPLNCFNIDGGYSSHGTMVLHLRY